MGLSGAVPGRLRLEGVFTLAGAGGLAPTLEVGRLPGMREPSRDGDRINSAL